MLIVMYEPVDDAGQNIVSAPNDIVIVNFLKKMWVWQNWQNPNLPMVRNVIAIVNFLKLTSFLRKPNPDNLWVVEIKINQLLLFSLKSNCSGFRLCELYP